MPARKPPSRLHQRWPAVQQGPDTAWQDRAACRDRDPELWTGDPGRYPESGRHREAIAICATCPVRAACLDYALDQHIEHGIWGGLLPGQRTSRRRAIARRRTRREEAS